MTEGRFVRLALAVVIVFIAGVVLKAARTVLFPFALAVFLSYVADLPIAFLVKRKFPQAVAVVIVLLVTFVVLYLVVVVFYASGQAFVEGLPRYSERWEGLRRAAEARFALFNAKGGLASLWERLDPARVAASALGILGPFLAFFSNLLVVFIFLALLVAGRGRFLRKLGRILAQDRAVQTGEVVSAIHRQVQKYVVIKTLMSLVNGLVVWVILTAFGVDFAAVHGFLAFLLNFIPNFGSFIAAALRVLLTLIQFGTPWVPLAVLITTVGADTLMGSLVEPRLTGRGLDLSPLVVFFALVFWGWLWGVAGMILAVPITGVMKIVCDNVPPLRFLGVLMGGGKAVNST